MSSKGVWRYPTISEGWKSNSTNSKEGTNHTNNSLPRKIHYHTNNDYATLNFTGRSTGVEQPPHQYPTRSKFVESANHIVTFTPDAIFYLIKLLINAVIHPETGFAQEYRHLVKEYEKMVWHKYFFNELGRLARDVGNRVTGSNAIFFVPKSQVPQDQKFTYGIIFCDIKQ